MAAITAAAVKELRERTGLPMMKCKQALTASGGDQEKAIEQLREEGAKTMATKAAERSTAFGRFGIHAGVDQPAGAIVELNCESAPVAGHEEFVQLANDLAQALATSDGVSSTEELLALKSPSKPELTLKQQLDELYGRMREVFKVGRFQRYEGGTGGYSHNSGTISGVLVQVKGGTDEAAKDVAMHVAAMKPAVLKKEDIPSDEFDKEREILSKAARNEGKPDNIIEKMVEGRMRQFYAERALMEQPFVKDDKQSVGKYAKAAGMEVLSFVHWDLADNAPAEGEG